MTRLADEEISAWSQSTSVRLRIAARLAREIRDGKYDDWRPLPAAFYLAAEYDVSLRTACRAKALLAARGMISRHGPCHYASGQPAPAGNDQAPDREKKVSDERH